MKSLSELERHVDSICRNEKYSDYEKKLHIMTEIIIPLYRECEGLKKDNKYLVEDLHAMAKCYR